MFATLPSWIVHPSLVAPFGQSASHLGHGRSPKTDRVAVPRGLWTSLLGPNAPPISPTAPPATLATRPHPCNPPNPEGWQTVAGGRAQRHPRDPANETLHPDGMPEISQGWGTCIVAIAYSDQLPNCRWPRGCPRRAPLRSL